jgi:hypothetical protein
MKKTAPIKPSTPQDDVWDTTNTVATEAEEDSAMSWINESQHISAPAPINTDQLQADPGFDMEGLMTDFPTATELQKFVYDQTGFALNLKGRSNKLKYQIALDTLNGQTPPEQYVTSDNPYVDKNDLVPTDELRDPPIRDTTLPDVSEVQNYFHTRSIPHPDATLRADDKRVDVVFRKYLNGAISYEVLGPIEPRNIGEKLDKFGRTRPERITWIDPRTGEQCIKRPDGSMTAIGQKLRARMQAQKVNDTNQWDVWVDREFISINQAALDNPWA